jgi:hypothetical protein
VVELVGANRGEARPCRGRPGRVAAGLESVGESCGVAGGAGGIAAVAGAGRAVRDGALAETDGDAVGVRIVAAAPRPPANGGKGIGKRLPTPFFLSARAADGLMHGKEGGRKIIENRDQPHFNFPMGLPVGGSTPDTLPGAIYFHVNFRLDIAAITTDAAVDRTDKDHYWREATATGPNQGVSWSCDLSGTIGSPPNYDWEPITNKTGVAPPTGWTMVSGSPQLEDLSGPTMNEIANRKGWKSV